MDLTFPHQSFIGHGFSSDAPPITLQEMLDTGNHQMTDLEAIRGSEDFENPTFDEGRYPIKKGTVIWNFIHVQKTLPRQ